MVFVIFLCFSIRADMFLCSLTNNLYMFKAIDHSQTPTQLIWKSPVSANLRPLTTCGTTNENRIIKIHFTKSLADLFCSPSSRKFRVISQGIVQEFCGNTHFGDKMRKAAGKTPVQQLQRSLVLSPDCLPLCQEFREYLDGRGRVKRGKLHTKTRDGQEPTASRKPILST